MGSNMLGACVCGHMVSLNITLIIVICHECGRLAHSQGGSKISRATYTLFLCGMPDNRCSYRNIAPCMDFTS